MRLPEVTVSTKVTILFSVISLLALIAIGSVGYISTRSAYVNEAHKDNRDYALEIATRIEDTLSPVPKHLDFFTSFYALERYLQWSEIGEADKTRKWYDIMMNAFTTFIQTNEMFIKLRIIDAKGMEQLGINFDQLTHETIITPKKQLQDISFLDTFKETMQLKKDAMYVSQFNLSYENGKVAFPYQPTLRYAKSLHDLSGQTNGMLVLNLDGNYILDILQAKAQQYEQRHFYLINPEGFYLYHREPSYRWGFQLGASNNLQQDFPQLFAATLTQESGDIIENGKMFSFTRVYPLSRSHSKYWIVISEIDRYIALSKLETFNQFFGTIVIIIIILIIWANRRIRKLFDPLVPISSALKSIAEGRSTSLHVTTDQKDEIGTITRSAQALNHSNALIAAHAEAVARGNFTKEFTLRSSEDIVGEALNAMTRRLQEVTAIAEKVSLGSYDSSEYPITENDLLSRALAAMNNYLLNVARVVEAISQGNFTREFRLSSEKDLLGHSILTMTSNLKAVVEQAHAIAQGDYQQHITPNSKDDQLSNALITMTDKLLHNERENEAHRWLQEGLGRLNSALSGKSDAASIRNVALTELCHYSKGFSGVIFDYRAEKEELLLQASYALSHRDNFKNQYAKGEGLIGQVALERQMIYLEGAQDASLVIDSGLAQEHAHATLVFPLEYDQTLLGIIAIAYAGPVSELSQRYLLQATANISGALFVSQQNEKIKVLLEESRMSFEELQVRSEELQQSNVQLEEQSQELEQQSAELRAQNEIVEKARVELEAQAKELMRTNQYKSEFLANMSHELRTPLNSIILLSKMLHENKGGNLGEDEAKKADVIYRSGNDLLALINEILDLSKVDAGRMEVYPKHVDTAQMTQSLHALFDDLAKEKNLEFLIENTLVETIEIDEQKVMQILKNLLSNAFKFTKEGSITLRLSPAQLPYAYSFAVQDTGIGIAPKDHKMIFEAFKQVDGSISREFGGTGLGLSISRSFAQLLGGVIELKSTLNKGSTFTLLLPQGEIEESVESPDNTTVTALMDEELVNFEAENIVDRDTGLKDKTILIVDDDPRNIFTLSSLLQESGAITAHALSGESALQKLRKGDTLPDLILMDIMMPQMDGYETIRHIRSDAAIADIPIIAVTAKAMKEERQKCLDAGADDYLSKPVDDTLLVKLSASWIEKGRHA